MIIFFILYFSVGLYFTWPQLRESYRLYGIENFGEGFRAFCAVVLLTASWPVWYWARERKY